MNEIQVKWNENRSPDRLSAGIDELIFQIETLEHQLHLEFLTQLRDSQTSIDLHLTGV